MAERDQQFVQDLRAVRARIKNSWSLWEFMGVTEREVLVYQTIVAAVNNLDAHGEPYSIRGNGVKDSDRRRPFLCNHSFDVVNNVLGR